MSTWRSKQAQRVTHQPVSLIRHVLSTVDAARYTNCYVCMYVCMYVVSQCSLTAWL